jgi:O-methyltransferase involved in polyketide biosynthesis
MEDRVRVDLGAVQQTLFVTLAGRARETGKRHPLLRDPKAVEILASVNFDAEKYGRGVGGGVTVLRTLIFDSWVRAFLAEHPAGTVVEIGTGLNTRFDRVDNGQVHWIDLDLPDTIELRRRFFADSDRRRMIAASVLDEDWLAAVKESPPLASPGDSLGRSSRSTPTASACSNGSISWRPERTSRPGGHGRATTRAHSSRSASTSCRRPR